MYAVTGATGQLGRLVIASLLGRVAPGEVVALARDPAKASDLRGLGILVRAFDYDAPDQLAASLEGVTRLLFISSDNVERRIGQHRAVVAAAARTSPALTAYTSIIHADVNPISLADSHRETERMIAVTGLPYAILRGSCRVPGWWPGVTLPGLQ